MTDLPPEQSEALKRIRVRHPYEQRVTACWDLHRYVREQLKRVTGDRFDDANQLLLAIVLRAVTTHEAQLRLLESRLTEQAAMLVRPLFEAVVDAYYVWRHPADAVRAVEEQRLLLRALLIEEPGVSPSQRPSLTEEEERRLPEVRKKLGVRGDKHWLQAGSLFKRIEAIEPVFPELEPGELRRFYENHNQHANKLLHGSSPAFDAVVRKSFGERLAWAQVGATDEYADEAVLGNLWLAYRLGWLVVTQWHGACADEGWASLNNLMLRAMQTCAHAWMDELFVVSPDDDCPCGSGRPAGECHKDENVRRYQTWVQEEVARSRGHPAAGKGPDDFGIEADSTPHQRPRKTGPTPPRRPPPQRRRRHKRR